MVKYKSHYTCLPVDAKYMYILTSLIRRCRRQRLYIYNAEQPWRVIRVRLRWEIHKSLVLTFTVAVHIYIYIYSNSYTPVAKIYIKQSHVSSVRWELRGRAIWPEQYIYISTKTQTVVMPSLLIVLFWLYICASDFAIAGPNGLMRGRLFCGIRCA